MPISFSVLSSASRSAFLSRRSYGLRSTEIWIDPMALYRISDSDVWARQALERSGYELTLIQRVFPATDDDDVEVIYLDGEGDPRTAYLMPDGTVLATRAGW